MHFMGAKSIYFAASYKSRSGKAALGILVVGKISRGGHSKRTDRLLDAVGNFLILTSGEFDTMKLYVLELRILLRMMLVARFSRSRAK